MSSQRPNILLIQTDQQRWDSLGVAGNSAIHTPALDGLAEDGIYCERMYVSSPLCMPSRASLATGRNIRGHGVWTNGVPLPDQPTIASRLKEVGYRTASIGKLHFTPFGMPPLQRPFGDGYPESFEAWPRYREQLTAGSYYGIDHVDLVLGHNRPDGHYGDWLREHHPEAVGLFGPEAALSPPTGAMQSWVSGLPVGLHSSTWIGDRTEEYLETATRSSQPFFLWVSFPDPHHPFAPPAPYSTMYDPELMPLPRRREGEWDDKPSHFREFARGGVLHEGAFPEDVPTSLNEDSIREITAHTYGMISLVDHNVGRILARLEDLGLAGNTIVMFTSDHGELLGDHGLILKGPYMYEALIRAPFIMRWPERWPQGVRATGLWSQTDVFPTLMEAAGVEVESEGMSMCRLAEDIDAGRDAVLVEYRSGYYSSLVMKTLCTARWKLTCYQDPSIGELYDLDADPDEFDNRYATAPVADTQADLVRRLLSEVIATEPLITERYSHA